MSFSHCKYPDTCTGRPAGQRRRRPADAASALAAPVSREARIQQLVAPQVSDAQAFAQPALTAEPELLNQRDRHGVVRMDERLRTMQAEVPKAEVKHRRNRLGSDALSLAGGVDDVADAHTLIADVTVVVIDEANATIGCGICIVSRIGDLTGSFVMVKGLLDNAGV